MEGGPLTDSLPWTDSHGTRDSFTSSVLNSAWLWGKGTAVSVESDVRSPDAAVCSTSYGLLGNNAARKTPEGRPDGNLIVVDVRACAAELTGSESSGGESPPRLVSVADGLPPVPPQVQQVPFNRIPMSMLLPLPRQGQNQPVKVSDGEQGDDDVTQTRFTSLENTHDILETVASMLEIPHEMEGTSSGTPGTRSPYSCGQGSGMMTPSDSPLSVLSNHSSALSPDITLDVTTTINSIEPADVEGIMTSLTSVPHVQQQMTAFNNAYLPPVSQVLTPDHSMTSQPQTLAADIGTSSVLTSQTLTSGGTVTTHNENMVQGSMMGFLNSESVTMETEQRHMAPKHHLDEEMMTSPKRIKVEDVHQEHVMAEGQRSRGHGRGGKKGTCLPPCKVCGARGTGFHYGVTTCEACKGFFRRCLTRKHSPVCHGKGNIPSSCDISHGVPNACPHCRYQKCLTVGMSVKAIRLGRYTLSKKTQDIIEVKHLEAKHKQDKIDTVRVGEIESFIDEIMAAHKEIMDWWKTTPGMENLESVRQDAMNATTHPSGSAGAAPLSTEDFLALYQKTGVKADERIEKISLWGELFEVGVTRLVQFIKKVPGFRKLGSADQLQLIKSSYMENVIIGRYSLFDPLTRMYYAADGSRIQPFGLDVVLGQEMTSRILSVAEKLQKMQPTYEELAFLKMLNIFSTERHNFEDPLPVKETHDLCLEALLYVIKTSPRAHVSTSPGLRFAKMIDVLLEVRSFNHDVSQFFKKTILTFTESQLITLPPLFGEIVKSA